MRSWPVLFALCAGTGVALDAAVSDKGNVRTALALTRHRDARKLLE